MERSIELIDAVPYLRAYAEQCFVVKVGGELLAGPENRGKIARDIAVPWPPKPPGVNPVGFSGQLRPSVWDRRTRAGQVAPGLPSPVYAPWTLAPVFTHQRTRFTPSHRNTRVDEGARSPCTGTGRRE
jgi:hypothetical protein